LALTVLTIQQLILEYVEPNPEAEQAFPLVVGAMGLLLFILWSMTIQITETHLRHWFGLGFWKKEIPLAEIQHVEVSKTPWYTGYGIRFVGKGWLYNVSGVDRVELHLRNNSVIYLGTDDPEKLYNHLSESIHEDSY
jgi:hypothetical protein